MKPGTRATYQGRGCTVVETPEGVSHSASMVCVRFDQGSFMDQILPPVVYRADLEAED